MKTKRKNKSIVIFILLVIAFFLSVSPLSIKAGESSMSRAEQEEETPQCKGPENPVGETLDTAIAFVAKLDEILSQIINTSNALIASSNDLEKTALGCDKKRCGDKCENVYGSECCEWCTSTDSDGNVTTYCCETCNNLIEDCHSYCYPPPCGVGGMDRINSDLVAVQGYLDKVKSLQKEYERTLISYIDIYKWAFGEMYQCNDYNICTDIGRASIGNKIKAKFKGPIYLNDYCNGQCPNQSQVKGYACKDVNPPGSTQGLWKCQAVGGSFAGAKFPDLSSCQKSCGNPTYKCDTTTGMCLSTLNGSGNYTDVTACNNNCKVGMAIAPLNIAPIGECNSKWASTSLGNSTICEHGDSLTDVTMVANYCGKSINPEEALTDILKKAGTVDSNGDINWNIASCPCRGYLGIGVIAHNRISSEMNSYGYADALTFLQDRYLGKGIPVAVECDPALGSTQQDGYYSILLRGYDKNNDTVYYNDPKTGTEKTMSSNDYYNNNCYSDKTSGKQALIIYCEQ